ncbi:MAG: biotin--[acetyl-CoA-carboxylase] ligase [Phycisphaeraceae bacterium]
MTPVAILDYLLFGGSVSSDLLRYDLGAEADDIAAAITQLRQAGCEIEPDSPTSYRLHRTGLGVWADYLAFHQRRTGSPQRIVEVYRSTASTQDLVKARLPEPLLVVADHQSAGRGRLGRPWLAPPRACVLMSFTHVLDAGASPDRVAFVASVAVARAIEKLTGRRQIGIKWPNDLVVDGRKLGGVLVETRLGMAVIGIGINVDLRESDIAVMPEALRDKVTSLAMLGCPKDRLAVAGAVIEQVDADLAIGHIRSMVDEWRCRSVLSARHVRLSHDGHVIEGDVVDLDPLDGLIVRTREGAMLHLPAASTTVLAW